MKCKPTVWLTGYLSIILVALGLIAFRTIHVDPFFHFHQPYTNLYFYPLDNQRCQNYGITRYFDYTGMITGSSMTENFKTSEAEDLWNCPFIKVPFTGGSFKEINDNIKVAIKYNPKIKYVVRGLDMGMFIQDKDTMRDDLGQYPTYLYDDNPFNDVEYVFNRDVAFTRVYPMLRETQKPDFSPGITSFDEYSNWTSKYGYGKNYIFPSGITISEAGPPVHLSESDASMTRANIIQNVTDTPRMYPNVTFYYFFTPYSAHRWMVQLESGIIYRQIEAERIVIEEILKCPNIKLYSFNCRFDITTNLNNYMDPVHYAEWINSLMLRYMHDEHYLLTPDNYDAYLEEELRFYTTYDYHQLNDQKDDATKASLYEETYGYSE